MTYVLPFDLYEDWKELMFMNELLVNFVKELKEQMAKGERYGRDQHSKIQVQTTDTRNAIPRDSGKGI